MRSALTAAIVTGRGERGSAIPQSGTHPAVIPRESGAPRPSSL